MPSNMATITMLSTVDTAGITGLAERNLLRLLIEWVNDHDCTQDQSVLGDGLADMSYHLSIWFFKRISCSQVWMRVVHCRRYYHGFRRFLANSDVEYNRGMNQVTVKGEYANTLHLETPTNRIYRTEGCEIYDELDWIFRKKRTALLPREPSPGDLEFLDGYDLDDVANFM